MGQGCDTVTPLDAFVRRGAQGDSRRPLNQVDSRFPIIGRRRRTAVCNSIIRPRALIRERRASLAKVGRPLVTPWLEVYPVLMSELSFPSARLIDRQTRVDLASDSAALSAYTTKIERAIVRYFAQLVLPLPKNLCTPVLAALARISARSVPREPPVVRISQQKFRYFGRLPSTFGVRGRPARLASLTILQFLLNTPSACSSICEQLAPQDLCSTFF